jgi:hypothetical protein
VGDNLLKNTRYLTTNSIQTSVANQEIIPTPPITWTVVYKIKKLSFYNVQACNIIFEDAEGDTHNQYLYAGQGFNIDYNDPEILSFKIVQNNINYTYVMVY